MSNKIAQYIEPVERKLRDMMIGRVEASKNVFLKSQAVVRRQLYELPESLQGYSPALTWDDMTVRTWLHIRKAPPGTVIVSPACYLAVLEDSLRVTGPTPWCDPTAKPDMAIMFAGRWIAPDLEQLQPKVIKVAAAPQRLGRLRLISGLQMLQLHIPRASCRGTYRINQDACYVDMRRLKRHKRRFKEDMRRIV